MSVKRNLLAKLETQKYPLFLNLTFSFPKMITTPTNSYPIFQQRTATTAAPPIPSIYQHAYKSLIITNTVVGAFSIILMITLTGFLIFLLLSTNRRRWQAKREIHTDLLPSFNANTQFMGHRLNPLYDPSQFGTTVFHQTHALLHPFWTPSSPPPAAHTTPNQTIKK
ncbi:unnamed protein product [Didymodactylos carnosus]|uniref:Uncharacterized protein n=1 Tax=Didymodactylos carnosus TaxID=1234261 RepID=A0A814U482_9BILA|nr:unnamed protein product [Didymodactylos carnosus]CAF3933903.1 unnamed protein product [Didymodactylos carnosus]